MYYKEFALNNNHQSKECRLITYICNAMEMLYRKDQFLLANEHGNTSERSIVFRFAHYLQMELYNDVYFSCLNLDCEYNKNQYDLKRTIQFSNGTYPDLILHKRGDNSNNYLIIEFKGYWNEDCNSDKEKLKDFTSKEQCYRYKMGLSILFGETIDNTKITIIKNGEIAEV